MHFSRRNWKPVALWALLSLLADSRAACAAVGAEPAADKFRELYDIHCSSCHGAQGDGEGPAAYLVYPKPRNFKTGLFRFRSTPSGSLPTDADLARTVRLGLPGSAMPAFGGILSEEQLGGLVKVVKGFCDNFKTAPPVSPIVIPKPPRWSEALVAQGRQVYQSMGCAACHGPTGHGDGPAAPNLKDDRGFPIPAKDFTRGAYKSGPRPEDIYRTFVTGLDGTPMPSFGKLFEPGTKAFKFADPGWSLVYYIMSLQPPSRVQGAGAGATIQVGSRTDLQPYQDPMNLAWHSVSATEVTLRPLWTRNEYPQAVSVRAVQANGRLALRMEWEDATADTGALGATEFPDKAAVSFPLGDELPFIGMGSRASGKDGQLGVVNIWCWRADTNLQLSSNHFADVGDANPLAEVDWYPFERGWRSGDREDAAAGEVTRFNPEFLTGWGAGNAVSDPLAPTGQITEYDSVGFGTLTAQSANQQDVTGRGHWALGHWSVVFVRDLYTGGDGDVSFTRRGRVPVAFAVWDGHHQDRDGEKSVSNWHWLVFEHQEEGD